MSRDWVDKFATVAVEDTSCPKTLVPNLPMKSRFLTLCAFGSLVLASTVVADAASVTVRHRDGPGRRDRTTVVVRTGHPIHRPARTVIVRRPHVHVRVGAAVFLPVVVWRPVVIARPAADRIVWQDTESLERADDWSELTLNSDQRGERLYLDVTAGKVQFDFAEVVFENGDCQVVDFNEKTHGKGFYLLLDFKDGRKVDHVRLVARARSKDAKVALVMAK
jgi:hypothetical protein